MSLTIEECVATGGHHPGPVRRGILGGPTGFAEYREKCTACGAFRQGLISLSLSRQDDELRWGEWISPHKRYPAAGPYQLTNGRYMLWCTCGFETEHYVHARLAEKTLERHIDQARVAIYGPVHHEGWVYPGFASRNAK